MYFSKRENNFTRVDNLVFTSYEGNNCFITETTLRCFECFVGIENTITEPDWKKRIQVFRLVCTYNDDDVKRLFANFKDRGPLIVSATRLTHKSIQYAPFPYFTDKSTHVITCNYTKPTHKKLKSLQNLSKDDV